MVQGVYGECEPAHVRWTYIVEMEGKIRGCCGWLQSMVAVLFNLY